MSKVIFDKRGMKNIQLKGKVKIIGLLLIAVLSLIAGFAYIPCQADSIDDGIYIDEIKLNKSSVLSDEELEEIINDYEGKIINIGSLKTLVNSINELYLEKGYITSRAILPAQKIEDNVVRIQLVEGRVGEIILSGNDTTDDEYILERISIQADDLIKLRSLENELFKFNAVNDISLKSELKAGKEFGTTDLILKAFEPEMKYFRTFYDNAGRDETGLNRYGLSFTDNSFYGYRDRMNMVFFGAKGMKALSIKYSLPVFKYGTRLNFSYNNNATDIISGEYETVNIEGDYQDYSYSINHPFLFKNGIKIDSYLEYSKKFSDTYFSGVNILTTDIETYTIGVANRIVNPGSVHYTSFNLKKGNSTSGKDNYTDPGTIDDFYKYNLYYETQKLLKDRSNLNFKCNLQSSNNKLLPSSEQFSLGGISSVRGYKEGLLTGDKGYFISMELNKKYNDKVDYFMFWDHGGAFPYKGNNETITAEDYLTSVGQGFSVEFTEDLSGKFIIGFPLEKGKEPRLHFTIQRNW
ncbi:MAG: ShlB/FhaC/HecB family hemolysin secretion/activation protein [bacterium]